MFPHRAGLSIGEVRVVGGGVRIDAASEGGPVSCSGCGTVSARVHSRYRRRLLDTAVAGREVLVRVRVRRLFCDNAECDEKDDSKA